MPNEHRLSVPTYAALRAKMPSVSQDAPAADANAGNVGSTLQNTRSSTHDPETAHRIALLEHFIAFSISSGITNLGVLLEIMHLADYDLDRATRIAELVKQSPPEMPAVITQSGNASGYGTSKGTTTDPRHGFGYDHCWNPIGAVQASVGENGCSAAAASQYSVAVVGCGPNSAGVAVGTSAGTTTSTAVPLSAVTSLPSNTNLNVTTNTGAQVGLKATPNDGSAADDQTVSSNQRQSQSLRHQQSMQTNNTLSREKSNSILDSGIAKSTIPTTQHAASTTKPAFSPFSYPSPHVSVVPPTAPPTTETQKKAQAQAPSSSNNGHMDDTSNVSSRPPAGSAIPVNVATNGGAGTELDAHLGGESKLPAGVSPQMKLEDLFQYLKTK